MQKKTDFKMKGLSLSLLFCLISLVLTIEAQTIPNLDNESDFLLHSKIITVSKDECEFLFYQNMPNFWDDNNNNVIKCLDSEKNLKNIEIDISNTSRQYFFDSLKNRKDLLSYRISVYNPSTKPSTTNHQLFDVYELKFNQEGEEETIRWNIIEGENVLPITSEYEKMFTINSNGFYVVSEHHKVLKWNTKKNRWNVFYNTKNDESNSSSHDIQQIESVLSNENNQEFLLILLKEQSNSLRVGSLHSKKNKNEILNVSTNENSLFLDDNEKFVKMKVNRKVIILLTDKRTIFGELNNETNMFEIINEIEHCPQIIYEISESLSDSDIIFSSNEKRVSFNTHQGVSIVYEYKRETENWETQGIVDSLIDNAKIIPWKKNKIGIISDDENLQSIIFEKITNGNKETATSSIKHQNEYDIQDDVYISSPLSYLTDQDIIPCFVWSNYTAPESLITLSNSITDFDNTVIFSDDKEDKDNFMKYHHFEASLEWFRGNLDDRRDSVELLINTTIFDNSCSYDVYDDTITLLNSYANPSPTNGGCEYSLVNYPLGDFTLENCSNALPNIGCDGVPGSPLIFDICGICGGDGSTCEDTLVTLESPSSTPTPSVSVSPTSNPSESTTPSLTSTPTPSSTLSPTSSNTPTPSVSTSPTNTPTPSTSLSPTSEPSQTSTPTPTPSSSLSPTSSISTSPTLSISETSTKTTSLSMSPTPSTSVTPSSSVSVTPSSSNTSSVTPSISTTPTCSNSASIIYTHSVCPTDSPVDVCGIPCGTNECVDCNGIVNGDATLDQCNICDGDGTSCLDCSGIPFGSLEYDQCGICNGDGTSCLDCNGVINGSAVIDQCGDCDGDGTSCLDCNSVINGPAMLDLCNVCDGQNECLDCEGTPFGDAFTDICGTCNGNIIDPLQCPSSTPSPSPMNSSSVSMIHNFSVILMIFVLIILV